jgi:uncharacterized protein YecE (DUF72 family)
MADNDTHIRVGIGGWSYEPWRKTFYPSDVPKKNELHFASRQLTAIEINSTFYRLQTPSVFAKWRDETPEDFVFSLKAPRYVTNRRVLAEAGETMGKFLVSGITELGAKLGPILWQLAPTKKFAPDDIEAFFKLLPDETNKLGLRHAFEVRHESFMCEEYVALARKYRITTVFADSDTYPTFADVTGDFVYARLMKTVSTEKTGYPAGLPRVAKPNKKNQARDVFAYFISGAKERAPAAAMRVISMLQAREKGGK